MLIYYGYPALINGSQNQDEAVQHFSRYSQVVLGDGLQDPRHPNHEAVREIVGRLGQVRFLGYIDLGVYSPHHRVQNLGLEEIAARARGWRELGMVGVLLDDYGYDFANTRQRQVEAVAVVHDLGLSVMANSWDPRHALDGQPTEGNPKGLPSPLGDGDSYLYESYLVQQGGWVSFKQWRAKANTLAKLLKGSKVQIFSCTTTQVCHDHQQSYWEFASQCAWLEGHRGFAWGEPHFSASDNQAPWRPRPKFPTGRRGAIRARGAAGLECDCAEGLAVVDFAGKSFEIQPGRPWWKRWRLGW